MTCIIGLVNKGTVWLGGDSMGSDDYNYQIQTEPKVFKKGEMIFGSAGDMRAPQLLRYALSIPRHNGNVNDMQYLTTIFTDAVIECFKARSYAKVNNSVVESGGYRGKLYKMESNFQTCASVLNYEAVGCGGDYAKGAMYALLKGKSTTTALKTILTKALEAAAAHSVYVKPPWHFVSLSGNKRNE